MNTYRFIYVSRSARCNCGIRPAKHQCEFKPNEEVVNAHDSISAFHVFNDAMLMRNKKLKQVVCRLLDVQEINANVQQTVLKDS